MSKLFKTCVIKPWVGTKAHDPATPGRHFIRSAAVLTLWLLSMLVAACGQNISSNRSPSPGTNSQLATVTNTAIAQGSKQDASSTTTPATPTPVTKATASNTPSSNPKPPTVTPHKSNPPTVPTTIVEADPSSFTVTIHGFTPSATAGQNTEKTQSVELDNKDPSGIIHWSVLIEMFDGKSYGWLSISTPGGKVQPGKSLNVNIIVSVSSAMPPGEYKGCVEFLPPNPQDHCNNPDDETNKEVFVDLIVEAASSAPTSQPVAPPPPIQQPTDTPTPTSTST